MKELEKLLKALGNRRRLAILQYLKKCHEASVSSIAETIKLSFKATSKHLIILIAADVLEREQRSTLVYYKISPVAASSARHIISVL